MFRVKEKSPGFTLIELLIVIAIVLILIAIALPNFQEVQMRAKVTRVRSEFQSLATALETYCLDYRSYPYFNEYGFPAPYNPISYRLIPLTTPNQYIANIHLRDPFLALGATGYTDEFDRYSYNYRNHQFWKSSTRPWVKVDVWVLNSLGPDGEANQGLLTEIWARGLVSPETVTLYSPTNGTLSRGDIPRTGGASRFQG